MENNKVNYFKNSKLTENQKNLLNKYLKLNDTKRDVYIVNSKDGYRFAKNTNNNSLEYINDDILDKRTIKALIRKRILVNINGEKRIVSDFELTSGMKILGYKMLLSSGIV